MHPEAPAFTGLELVDGGYVEVATAHGDELVQAVSPFPVRLVPAGLLDD